MKKLHLTALILGAFAGLAHADDGSSLTLYGVMDVAYGHEQHSLGADPQFPASVNPIAAYKRSVTSSVSGLFNGGISDSRVGIRGVENLGGGMKAFFVLESGFNVPTGAINNGAGALATNGGTATTNVANTSLNGQFFNRQSYVGLSDSTLGALAIGRNYAPIFDIVVAYDPVQASQLFSPLGFSGTIGGGGGVSEDTRVDNSLKYTNKIGNFNVGALYKAGEQSGVSAGAGSGMSLNGGYESGDFGVQAAYEAFRNAVKGLAGATPDTVKVAAYDTQAWFLAAKYKATETTTLRGGFERYKLMSPATPFLVTNYYNQTISNTTEASQNFAGAAQRYNIVFVGGDVNVTSELNIAAAFYSQRQLSSDTYNGVAGNLSGHVDSYSLLADYHFSKKTDVYAGMMYSKFRGDAYPTDTYWGGNYIVATGLRVKF